MRVGGALALALAALAAAGGCPGRESEDVAELTRVLAGTAERNVDDGPWQKAAAGARFRERHSVRTSKDGGARLQFMSGGSLKMGPATTIRFGPGKVAVDGELEAEEDAVLELEMGTATIAAGSKVRIGPEGAATRFDVLVGSAVVTRENERRHLTAGESLDFELGGSRLEKVKRTPAKVADAGPPAAADAAPVAATADAGPPIAPGDGAATAEVKGKAARARPPGQAKWSPLPVGAHPLAAGTAVVVPRGGSLLVSRGDERADVKGAAELVVAPAGEDGALVETSRGSAVVRATAADVSVRVPGGLIIARRGKGAGSRANLRVEPRATTVDVDSGVVDVQGRMGGKERLVLGQKGEIARGGGLAVLGRPPQRADFTVRAATSATIHDPAPPTDVRFTFGELCKGGGVLELTRGESFDASRRRIAGEGSAIARLERGSHRYRVRCLVDGEVRGDPVAAGRLRVVRDAGTRPLPRAAPKNTVDADGRPYTVLYQNLLPSITFRWSAAPKGVNARLVVSPTRGKTIDVAAPGARYTMPAGKLPEGEYRYWFAGGPGVASKKSVLRIEFDNAAATGYVQTPRAGATWGGSTVELSGAAVEGWKVSVGGQVLPLDRQRRFHANVSRDPAENGIAIEFRHPSRGVHLYVRRGRKR
ncbi:MAG TPA: hypothetical protein VFU21_09325 [Kofleriaceae bacterium]|nr:hypothetical protein [Kofleriaceae bacterium]